MRTLLACVATLIVGFAAGLGAVAVAQNQQPQPEARSAAMTDSRIVRELQDMNRKLLVINETLGGYARIAPSQSLRDVLKTICENTAGDRLSLSC